MQPGEPGYPPNCSRSRIEELYPDEGEKGEGCEYWIAWEVESDGCLNNR